MPVSLIRIVCSLLDRRRHPAAARGRFTLAAVPLPLMLVASLHAGGMTVTDVPRTEVPQAVLVQPTRFDHSRFDALLHRYVTNGTVDYDAFAGAMEFREYLADLARADPGRLSRQDQLAFWINAYNAYTIQLIIQHHERRSIRNINRSFGFVHGNGPWQERLAFVGGRAYSLDDIEQDILRRRFREPRIHFAVVCAAMGCPPLRSEAYSGERLDAQLDDQARTFLLASPSKNRVDLGARTVYVSPIFIEFRDYIEDFGGTRQSVGRFIATYYADGLAKQLLTSGNFTMVATSYDWTLNSQQNAESMPRETSARPGSAW